MDLPQMVLGAMTPTMVTSSRILAMDWIYIIRRYGTHALDVMLLEEVEYIRVTLVVEANRVDEPQV